MKWNNYTMASSWFTSSQPNEIGVVDSLGVYSKRTNHSWGKTSGPSNSVGYSTFGDGSISTTFPTSRFNMFWTSNDELALVSKLINKVKGHSFSMGVALAEVDELAGTIVSTIKTLAYGVDDLRRLRFAQFARRFGASPPSRKRQRELSTRDISGRWLGMQYAWLPAIGDAYEAVKAFEAISNGPRRQRFKASKSIKEQTWYGTNYCVVPQTVTVRVQYMFEMYEELSFSAQIGVENPATIIWERLPWSFVIDWFIPIGTYLSVLGVLPKMKGRWLRTASIRHNSQGSFPCDPGVSGGLNPSMPYPSAMWEVFNLQRTTPSGILSPPLPKVQLIGAVHGKRILNAIALAHQKFF